MKTGSESAQCPFGPAAGKRGRRLGAAVGQIVAIARVNELVIVTANVNDFRRFERLEVANWFR